MPAEQEVHVAFVKAPTALEDVPDEQGEQAPVPSMNVPGTHAAEQEGDPADEYVPALQARQVISLDAPKAPV